VTANALRAAALERALRAGLARDHDAVVELCTEDVRVWTPAAFTSSVAELLERLEHLEEAFSDVELEVRPLDVGGDYACAEWTVSLTHTGPLGGPDGALAEPTGARIVVDGVTVCEFRADRICSLRQYWDELALIEQLATAPLPEV
jgi:ketosteroid isomerase-like protein